MNPSTPNEQIEALQSELIQLKKRGDRTESRQDNRHAESEILGKLGIAYYQDQQWHSAITTLTEYFNLARELGNQTNEAVAHYYLGFTQQAIAELDQAVAAFFQGYRLFRQLQQHEFAAQLWPQLVQQGQRYLQNQQFPEAVALYKRQIQVLLEFGDLKASAEIAVELGKVYYYQPDFPEAIACFTSALDTAQTLKDQTLENLALAWLGCSHWQGGDLSQGLQYLEQRLALVQQLENRAAQEETLTWLIQICQQLDHPDKLIQSYQLQANFWPQQGEPVNQHLSLYELAIYQFNRQQYPEALSGFQVALELATTLNDEQEKSWKTANTNYMLGECYLNLGENQVAIYQYQQAVELYLQVGAKDWAEKGLGHLLNLYRELQQAEQEINCQKKRFQLIEDKGEDITAQSLAYEIGNLYNHRQQFTQALEYYQEALILSKKLEQPQNLANAAYMVADCYRNLRQRQAAISGYEQAVDLYWQVGVKDWAEKGLGHLLNLYRELQQAEQEINCQKKRFQLIEDKGEDITAQSLAYEIGNLYNHRQQFTQALEYYQEALILSKKLEQPQNLANAAYMVANCYRNLGQRQAAISGYEQAVELYVEVKEKKWALSTLDHLVNLYRELKQNEQVLASYQRRLEILRELGDAKAEQSCLYNIGSLYDDLKQWENALEYFDLAMSLAQKLELKHSQANAHYMRGQCCRNLGQQEAAISWYEQAVGLYVEVKETKWTLSALDYLVNLYRELKQDEQVIASYQRRLGIFRELGDRSSEHSCLYKLAMFQFDTQNYHDALSGFEAALQIAESLDEGRDRTYKIASDQYMVANCYRNLGQQEAATSGYEQAVGLYLEVNDRKWALSGLDYLVNLYRELKQDEQVTASYQRRLEILRELGDRLSEQSCLYNIGNLYDDQKQWDLAREYFVAALQLAKELDETYKQANAHYMLGSTYENLKQLEQAIVNYENAVDIYIADSHKKEAGKALDSLVRIYKSLKDYEKAINCQKQRLKFAKEIDDRQNEQTALYRLGCVYESNQQYSQGVEYLTSSLTLANELNQKGNAANAHYMLGCSYEKLEQLDEAIGHYRKAKSIYAETGDPDWVDNSRLKIQKIEEKTDPTNPNYWLERAIALMRLADYHEAITYLESAIQLDSNHPEAWLQKTYALLELKQYPEALESSKRTLDLNPNNAFALLLRGVILDNGFEMYVEALDAFNQALLIDGQNEDAIKNRELMRSKLSDLGFSQEEISQPKKIPFLFDLNNLQDCQKLGDFRKSQGKYREALLMYQRALSMNPNDDELWREKGNILWQIGEFQAGCDVYQKAIELNPNNIENYLAFGNNLLSKEINEGALACFNNVLRLTAMKSWKGWVGRGDALLNLGEYKEALDNFVQGMMRQGVSSTSLDYQEGTGALYYSLGCAHVREARKQEGSRDYWEKAQKCFQTSLPYFTNPNWQFDEWLLRLWQDLIPVERELGNTKAARKILYDAIELLNRLMPDELCKHEKERLSKEWSKLKQYHTDDLAEYKTLFLELLDGVDKDWNQEQVLEYLGEHRDDPYLIRWLNSFGRAELEKSWGTPDFDRGYLMMKLGNMDCGKVSQFGRI